MFTAYTLPLRPTKLPTSTMSIRTKWMKWKPAMLEENEKQHFVRQPTKFTSANLFDVKTCFKRSKMLRC